MRFSQADSTRSYARTPWSCQSEKNIIIIVILSFCNIVKGQANYTYESVFLDPDHLGIFKVACQCNTHHSTPFGQSASKYIVCF